MGFRYPVYKPSLGQKEKEYVNQCLDEGWISSKGNFLPRFEAEFSRYHNYYHASSVCNGTVALHLALLALDIREGDEVIVPSFTYIASVNAIKYVGAKPIFVDSNPFSWQLDPEDVRRKVSHNTKAIMAVHLYGHPAPMKALVGIAQEFSIYIIEDCAEAFGSRYDGRLVGTIGDVACFSFFGNKTITTGEGGMVVTKSLNLHEKILRLKGQGLAKNREYWHDIVGYNYRMTNICAAIGLAQIEKAGDILGKKMQIAKWYQDLLADTEYVMQGTESSVLNTHWMNSVLLRDASNRDNLRDYLKSHYIETRPLFFPVHTMPIYKTDDYLPVAESISNRGINLPSYPDLNFKDILEITNVLKKFRA